MSNNPFPLVTHLTHAHAYTYTHTHTHTHTIQGSDVVMRILHKKELGCHATTAVMIKEEDKENQNSRKGLVFWETLGGKKTIKGELRVI